MKCPAARLPVHHRSTVLCVIVALLGALLFGTIAFTGAPVVALPTPWRYDRSSAVNPYRIERRYGTVSFREWRDEVDCDLVWRTLANLYEESKLRQAAWKEAGYPLPVTAPPGKNVTEIHLLIIGGTWGRGASSAILRYLDVCRRRLPQPLIERDECALHYVGYDTGLSTYQLSKAALGLERGAPAEAAGTLRVNIHYRPKMLLVEGAQYLETILRGTWPTPSVLTSSFQFDAQCREHLFDVVAEMEEQMPLCLCEDTVDLDDHFFRRVPVDAIQVYNGLWDTQIPRMEYDLFEFDDKRVDWFFRQKRFSPDLSVYPFMTWEDNVARLRNFLAGNYVPVIRGVSGLSPTPAGVPMPRVLLSVEPKVNCRAAKFERMLTLNSTQRCRELALPLHDVVDEALLAAYGEPLLGFPRSVPPEWLRLVDYRPLSSTKSPVHSNYTGASIAPGEYLCTMEDGAHFDTHLLGSSVPPHMVWCARHADELFWDHLRQKP